MPKVLTRTLQIPYHARVTYIFALLYLKNKCLPTLPFYSNPRRSQPLLLRWPLPSHYYFILPFFEPVKNVVGFNFRC